MFSALVIAGTCCGYVGQEYRPIPVIHRRAPQESRPLPLIGDIGTGGLGSADYYRVRMGYQPFVVMDVVKAPEPAPFAKMMREVKKGFGRTMTRLPEVFGVSRQTLYNWLEGDTPKPSHQAKLRQLAESAVVFNDLGFKPTSQALDRKLSGGKSFLALLSEGCDGRETAKKLVRISQRGAESRNKLDELLGGRKARLDGYSIGTPSLNESV